MNLRILKWYYLYLLFATLLVLKNCHVEYLRFGGQCWHLVNFVLLALQLMCELNVMWGFQLYLFPNYLMSWCWLSYCCLHDFSISPILIYFDIVYVEICLTRPLRQRRC